MSKRKTSKTNKSIKPIWRKVPDSRIRHRWDLGKCGCQLVERSVYVPPTFYGDSGIPICEECGEDREYVRTEIREIVEAARDTKAMTVTIEGGVMQGIQNIPKGVRVRVLDFDTDGVPDEDLTKLRNGQKAVVSIWGKE